MANSSTKSPALNLPRAEIDSAPSFTLQEIKGIKPLPLDFYAQDTLTVARALLGKGLFVEQNDGAGLVEIVEVEAYLGPDDPASHAAKGPTPRNQSMFGCGGTCYVYLSYGINYCMNVTTREPGIGEAVLLRAGRPLWGLEPMRRRRGLTDARLLANGPGKLTQALGVDLRTNGKRFDNARLKIVDLGSAPTAIGTSRRIGISKAVENEWRFFVKDSPFLSRKRV